MKPAERRTQDRAERRPALVLDPARFRITRFSCRAVAEGAGSKRYAQAGVENPALSALAELEQAVVEVIHLR
jgi:hypothetical protein